MAASGGSTDEQVSAKLAARLIGVVIGLAIAYVFILGMCFAVNTILKPEHRFSCGVMI